MEYYIFVFLILFLTLLISFSICLVNISSFSSTYDIQEVPGFLNSDECDILISLSKDSGKLIPSNVYGGGNDLHNESVRKSYQMWLSDNDHDVVKNISKRVAEMTNTNIENQELLQLLKYSSGGFFNSHHDACNGTKEYCQRMNNNLGPRYITFLIYLNDDFSGGETVFPNINKSVKPEKGKAVIFYNTHLDGTVINDSLHGGNPIGIGEKWIVNKWIRQTN